MTTPLQIELYPTCDPGVVAHLRLGPRVWADTGHLGPSLPTYRRLGPDFEVTYPFCFFGGGRLCSMRDPSFPNWESKSCPLQREHGILTIGPPGKS